MTIPSPSWLLELLESKATYLKYHAYRKVSVNIPSFHRLDEAFIST